MNSTQMIVLSFIYPCLLMLNGCDISKERSNESHEHHVQANALFNELEGRIDVALQGRNNFAWRSKFSYTLSQDSVLVVLRISVLPVDEIRSVTLQNKKREWLSQINKKWNGQLCLTLSDGSSYPIIFDAKFSPINPDHKVIVRKGRGANQHNWAIDMPAAAAAHEFGHMLGAYDEYPHGALAIRSPIIDRSSIMGSRLKGGIPYPRHLSVLLHDIRSELNDPEAQIVIFGESL